LLLRLGLRVFGDESGRGCGRTFAARRADPRLLRPKRLCSVALGRAPAATVLSSVREVGLVNVAHAEDQRRGIRIRQLRLLDRGADDLLFLCVAELDQLRPDRRGVCVDLLGGDSLQEYEVPAAAALAQPLAARR